MKNKHLEIFVRMFIVCFLFRYLFVTLVKRRRIQQQKNCLSNKEIVTFIIVCFVFFYTTQSTLPY